MSDQSAAASTPALAAGPAPAPERSIDDHFADVPLFMRELGDEPTVALEALQSLAHDGTPDEVALNFKEQGNEYFVGKRPREALGFYTQGIEASPTDKKLLEVLYVNRAACNLALENYRAVLGDCADALTLNPISIKALFRASSALLLMEKYAEAIDCAGRGLTIPGEETNKALKEIVEKATKRKEVKERREGERKERARRETEGRQALSEAFKARGLVVQTSDKPPDNPAPPHFDPECIPETALATVPLLPHPSSWQAPPAYCPLIFSVFLLYPTHGQSDLLSAFDETTTFADNLAEVFAIPPSWDREGAYRSPKDLVVYAETANKKLLKIPRKMKLMDVFAAAVGTGTSGGEKDGLPLRDGLLSFVVLPKGAAEDKWVSEVKARRDNP